MWVKLSALVCLAAIAVHSQTLPTKAQILAKMKLANDYFITNKAHDPCASCLSGSHPSNIWTRGVYYEGDLAYYALSGDTAALNHAVRWGTFHTWSMRSGNATTNADDQCVGQDYIDLYRIDPTKSERIANIKTCIDAEVSGSGVNYWTWIDAIHMSMPVFAKLGKQYPSSTGYFSKMYSLYNYPKTTLGLYNTTDHLWWRDATFVTAKSPAGKNVYWSRGNGWVFAALVRVLTELPATDSHKTEYETVFKDMAAALKAVQRADGFWNENLADPAHYGGKEVTGTGLFTYGMAWGVNNGLLVKADYLPAIANAWKAIADTAIFSNGALGYVQGSGSQPGDNGSASGVTPTRNMIPDFDDYGLGCVLLAGSEVAKLAGATNAARMPGNCRVQGLAPAVKISRGCLTIETNGTVPANVVVSDAMGRVVLRKEISGTDIVRVPSNAGTRVCFVRATAGGNNIAVGRIIMER
jgi:Predicted unsaturated glucuronyl hydrolase involved in regulation of bacterial surface properties, and related proteins